MSATELGRFRQQSTDVANQGCAEQEVVKQTLEEAEQMLEREHRLD